MPSPISDHMQAILDRLQAGALFHAAYGEMVRVRRADYERVQAEREVA